MNTKQKLIYLLAIALLGCESKPKMIVADDNTASVQPGVNATGAPNTTPGQGNMPSEAAGFHQVLADEILQAERYTYLHVTEGNQKFWIATSKREAQKGKMYLYTGGLMKTNFESLEFKRTFDTIYLVGNIIDATEHPGGNMAGSSASASVPSATNDGNAMAQAPVKDAVKLSELFKNKNKYDGKVITITGKCVKANNGIMGKNWVHIEDGSKSSGKAINLTVTTNVNIPVGSNVALTGKITLNKDFGSGYRYDIIMEDAGGI